jgi:ribosome biogenesis GTPase
VIKGRIIKALAGFYYVECDKEVIQCRARGKFRNEEIKPLVGDIVEITKEHENDGYIMNILPRHNALVRPPISNIDQALLVFSCKEPDFSPLLLDKFLMIMEHTLIEPIICISKMDLDESKEIDNYIAEYKKAGYQVLPISSLKKEGLEALKHIFKDKISVITGQSGVGKSSLLNAIDDGINIETQTISRALGRGKHTTRHVELLPLFDGYVADTPGFSSLELEMEPTEAATAYRDFKQYSEHCKFRGCLHDSEPNCAVKEAVSRGDISETRYQRYLQYLEEVKKKKERQYG